MRNVGNRAELMGKFIDLTVLAFGLLEQAADQAKQEDKGD